MREFGLGCNARPIKRRAKFPGGSCLVLCSACCGRLNHPFHFAGKRIAREGTSGRWHLKLLRSNLMLLLPRDELCRHNPEDHGQDNHQDKESNDEIFVLHRAGTYQNYASFLARISPTTAGLAFPLESFITWPFRKFNAASLPDL